MRLREEIQAVLRRGDGGLSAVWLPPLGAPEPECDSLVADPRKKTLRRDGGSMRILNILSGSP
jgi:hypothetical protein